MPRTLPRLATLAGGLLLSPAARRFAGRHAGKLTLASLAWELWQAHQAREAAPETPPSHPRRRWSGRRV